MHYHFSSPKEFLIRNLFPKFININPKPNQDLTIFRNRIGNQVRCYGVAEPEPHDFLCHNSLHKYFLPSNCLFNCIKNVFEKKKFIILWFWCKPPPKGFIIYLFIIIIIIHCKYIIFNFPFLGFSFLMDLLYKRYFLKKDDNKGNL